MALAATGALGQHFWFEAVRHGVILRGISGRFFRVTSSVTTLRAAVMRLAVLLNKHHLGSFKHLPPVVAGDDACLEGNSR